MSDCDLWLWNEASRAADEWYVLQCRDVWSSLYLYYQRGKLTVADDYPKGFKLGHSQRISPGWNREQVKRWIHEVARRLPCLPVSEEEVEWCEKHGKELVTT